MQERKSKTILDCYPLYKNKTEEEGERVARSVFRQINIQYIQFMMEKVMNGESIVFPHSLGTLGVVGRKQKMDVNKMYNGLSPNWKQTKELWERDPQAKQIRKLIFNTNEHSSGIRYKFLWGKKNIPIPNKIFYSLRICREKKRRLWREIMGGREYISITNYELRITN
jgi:hypothetical protein